MPTAMVRAARVALADATRAAVDDAVVDVIAWRRVRRASRISNHC